MIREGAPPSHPIPSVKHPTSLTLGPGVSVCSAFFYFVSCLFTFLHCLFASFCARVIEGDTSGFCDPIRRQLLPDFVTPPPPRFGGPMLPRDGCLSTLYRSPFPYGARVFRLCTALLNMVAFRKL
jgi:hypothetical protein